VIDLTQILAGPTSGRLLAEFGADVIKINSPQRKIDSHGFVNRGKRSILLDVESQQGLDVLWQLIEKADVVVHNFPKSTAERYGLGYQHVRAHRPEVVYVSVSCYGYGGMWDSRRGYETQGQAATGIMERAGRDGRPAVLGPYNLLDYGTGVVAAFAAALGLYHRTVSATGQHVSTSLAQVGTFHQGTLLLGHQGRKWSEPAGRRALGWGPLQRFYRARDGWLYLGAERAAFAALAALDGLESVYNLGLATEEELAVALEAAFARQPLDSLLGALTKAGIAAHRVRTLSQLMTDPMVRAQGLSITQISEEAGQVIMPGPAILLSGRRIDPGRAAPWPGSDAADVLANAGLSGRLQQLELAWIVQLKALPPGWEGF
jgi:crotonobetainyl-CoA:carnitine CoA-transferase CaiB-like acyl-CoA transferase